MVNICTVSHRQTRRQRCRVSDRGRYILYNYICRVRSKDKKLGVTWTRETKAESVTEIKSATMTKTEQPETDVKADEETKADREFGV